MEVKYPNVKVRLNGTDGNVFALLGVCTKALKRAGHVDGAKELSDKVFASASYDEAIQHMMSFVDVS